MGCDHDPIQYTSISTQTDDMSPMMVTKTTSTTTLTETCISSCISPRQIPPNPSTTTCKPTTILADANIDASSDDTLSEDDVRDVSYIPSDTDHSGKNTFVLLII
jgi:hypothetical protein